MSVARHEHTPPALADAETGPPDQGMVDLEHVLAQIEGRLAQVSERVVVPAAKAISPPAERLQILTFALGKTQFALDVLHVSEIFRDAEITHVPGVPGWVLGVINWHGAITSVVDFAQFLRLSLEDQPCKTIVIAQAGDQRIGLGVTNVGQIYGIDIERLVSPPTRIASELIPYLRGVIDMDGHLIHLLDAERLLLGPQMQRFS
jgi:purine-binding chemotaxis protein CheW